MRAAAALLLAAALAGCGGVASTPPGGAPAAGRQPTEIAVSTEQGGRFIGLTGPRRQHAEPFLGVPDTNFYALRSWIDRQSGETVHQLYVSDSYAGPPRDWNAARDAQGRPLRFIPISKNEITCQPSCSYAEEFAAAIPETELRSADRRADRHVRGALRRGENDRGAGRAGPGAGGRRSTGCGPGWRPLPPRRHPRPRRGHNCCPAYRAEPVGRKSNAHSAIPDRSPADYATPIRPTDRHNPETVP